MNNNIKQHIKKFKEKRILVIGDAMLDKYIHGIAERLSPEAPVPVILQKETSYRLGGAANVANNVKVLGAQAALVSIIGEDYDGKEFLKKMSSEGLETSGVYRLFDRPTIVKTRILAGHQQVVRIDNEVREEIDSFLLSEIMAILSQMILANDAVIISDYGKGVVNKELLEFIINQCNGCNKPVIIDPKPGNTPYYRHATLITPNHKETEEMSGIRFNTPAELERAGRTLLEKLECQYLLVTLGEKGMALFEKDKERIDIPSRPKSVFDVTGAGDLVVSVAALCLAAGCSFYDSAFLANIAAGIEVSKLGNASVTIEELISEFE